ncbi:hypothetical protein DFP73DRAFT_559272 [Morchella snyderi]|nr:hypothetical protein DFP73DRAFT_559272 [Morchella snyderi]
MNPHSHAATGGDAHISQHNDTNSSRDVGKESQYHLSLAQQINVANRKGHDTVNRLIMARFALGLQDHRLYREGILSFAFVYKSFEEEWAALLSLESTTVDPRIRNALQRLYSIPLLRTPQIAKDLQYFYGSTPFSTEFPTTLQRTAYVNHIRNVIAEKPHVLIAYAYNYYMALFAGGKILGYQMSKAKGFFPERYGMTRQERIGAGMNIFNFEIEKGMEVGLRDSFKGALLDLENTLTVEEKNDIIKESKAIYSNNVLIIKELDRLCAHIVATTTITRRKQFLNDKHKFLSFFAILACFLIVKHIINCL